MKKEIILPVLLLILGLLFIIINVIVYVSKGNSWFINRKLKIGTIIILLSSIVACHSIPRHTCYAPVEPVKNDDKLKNINKKDSVSNAKPIKKDTTERIMCYEMINRR